MHNRIPTRIRPGVSLPTVALLLLPCAVLSAETAFTMTRSVTGGGVYTPGGALDITVELHITADGDLTALGLEENLPHGWTYDSLVSGTLPAVEPFPGITGLLEFSWFPLPATYPVSFTYRVNIPEDATGGQQITGNGVARILETGTVVTATVITPLQAQGVAVPNVVGLTQEDATGLLLADGFVIGDVFEEYSVSVAAGRVKRTDPAAGENAPEGAAVQLVLSLGQGAIHTGDYVEDGVISLTELLRLIQFYNLGAYYCAEGQSSEDGYLPGTGGEHACGVHDSDTTADWSIDLTELLRFIQFFNSDGYHYCPDADPPTEDGFCPGP